MRGRNLTMAVTALALVAGCAAKRPPHPLTNEYRYTCCNIRYEKDEINDANYQVGTIIPFGTRVQILEVGNDRVRFKPEGGTPITLFIHYGKDIPMDAHLSRLFLTADPKAKLSKKMPAKKRQLLEQGIVEPGMTRDEVLLAIGYPPAHRTPSLSANSWHYWQNRWIQFDVYFDGDKVDRVQR